MRPLALAQLTNTSTGLDRLHVLKGWLKQLNDMGVVSGLQVTALKAEIARAEREDA